MKAIFAAAILISAMGAVVALADQPQSRTYAISAAPKMALNSEPVLFGRPGQTNEQSQLTWRDITTGNPPLTGVLPNGILATYN